MCMGEGKGIIVSIFARMHIVCPLGNILYIWAAVAAVILQWLVHCVVAAITQVRILVTALFFLTVH